ncbi:MAG: endonuclease/exonuclease/phosphatase family protein [Saprospiraceae bacterium]|nr:endonuclease/exonuclease/phosphatase family protein [Saprospiraceae bacterium]
MNALKCLVFISSLFLICGKMSAQNEQKKFKIAGVGFYNLENLFDTVNDTLINDEEFLPDGARTWTPERYQEKLTNMASVISQIGLPDLKTGLSVLGLSEIENRKVLEDLVIQPSIKDRNYQIIHYNSPDPRGVDVAFLYNPKHFTPIVSKPIPLIIFDDEVRRYTRDVLYIKGLLDTDTIHVMVNHWPSRGGGEAKTAPSRNSGAKLCRNIVDSLMAITPDAKIFVMGDLNDDPTNESLKSYLRTVSNIKDVHKTGMFNPYEDMYRRGQGSNAYRDSWSLFDQIVISEGVTKSKNAGYYYFKANVFNKDFLIQKTGQYKGYPFRTFSGDTYQSGFSDHFPSYIYLIKEITSK